MTTNHKTAFIFMLSDVLYQSLHGLEIELGKQGFKLRHEAKYRFNMFMDGIKKAKMNIGRTSLDVEKMGEKQTDYFFDDTAFLLDATELIYEKSFLNIDNQIKIMDFLESLKNEHYNP